MQDHEYPQKSKKSGFRYLFTTKHHGGGTSNDACWSIGEDEEFRVFDIADLHDLSDDRKWLYGVLRDQDGELTDLGTWEQQVAEFPLVNEGQPWHGYPLGPTSKLAPQHRRGQRYNPKREVCDKMLNAGLISRNQRRRLLKGDHA